MGEVSKLVWGVLGKIYDVFGAKGILATIILVKFPGLLRGAFSMLTGGLKGIASLFSSSKSVPQLVTVTNMGAMGGPGGGSPLDMMGGRGTFGKRLFGRSMYREMTTKGKQDFDMSGAKSDMGNIKLATAGSSYMGDGAVMPNGNAILTAKGQFFRTAPQDIITAAQPGRAGGGGYGGGNISVNGTINLQGAGVTKNMMEDAQFRREVTKMVTMGQKTDNR